MKKTNACLAGAFLVATLGKGAEAWNDMERESRFHSTGSTNTCMATTQGAALAECLGDVHDGMFTKAKSFGRNFIDLSDWGQKP